MKRFVITGILLLVSEAGADRSLVEQMSGWYQRAELIKNVLRSSSYEIGVPHVIWHYLDDADIRVRDPRYAEAQVLAVRQSIDEWA